MERPPAVWLVSGFLLAGCLWYGGQFWTHYMLAAEPPKESSVWILPLLYAAWYLLLLTGFLRMQEWARALFIYGTPLLFAIDVAVQLIEYDPLPADLLLSVAVYLLALVLLSRRKVRESFE